LKFRKRFFGEKCVKKQKNGVKKLGKKISAKNGVKIGAKMV